MGKGIPTIMVIDDTPANLRLLEDMLRDAGYRVLSFPRGDLALKRAMKTPPDLILLDIMMPGMDGFEVCKALKANNMLKDIPILFISARTDTENKVKAFTLGGVDYVTKPFQFEEVKARIATHLQLRFQKEQLRHAYEKLRQLEAERDKLVQMIIHDLRSPLTSIVANLELAKMYPLPDEASLAIDRALASTKFLTTMISSILDVSRIEEEKLPLRLSTIELNKLLNEAVKELEALKGPRLLEISMPRQGVSITCDPDILKRIIQNLVSNAFKFTDPREGIIKLSVAITDTRIVITVEDNGRGIPKEYHDKVFDKFFQVVAKEKGHKYSTGLGLTFCKLAVEAHGGKIWLQSEPDKGSRFLLEIPRSPSSTQYGSGN